MPDIIKFAFIQSDNLNRQYFQVPQAIVNIAVEGAEDPLTHQRLRDAVSDEFAATQKKVNDFITSRDVQISRLGVNERKRRKNTLIKSGNDTIQRLLAEFKTSAEAELEKFARQEPATAEKVEAAARHENWQTVRWGISVTWTGVKAIGGLVGAVSSGGLTVPLVIKEFVDNLVDLKKLFDDLGEHYMSLAQARKRVRDGLAGLKTKPRLTKSDVETFEGNVKLYEAKLLEIEIKARAISTRLNSALAAMPKTGIKPEAARLAEAALDRSIKELIDCSVSIKSAEKYLATLKKNLATARAAAKTDPALAAVKNWAVAAYTKINDFKDIVLSPSELATWIDAVIKIFGDTRNVLEE